MEPSSIAAVAAGRPAPTVTVGTLVARSVATWKGNLAAFTVVGLVFQVPSILLQLALGSPTLTGGGNPFLKPTAEQAVAIQEFIASGRYWWVVAVSMTLGLLHAGAVTSGAVRHLAGGRTSVRGMLADALRRGAPILVTGLLALLAVGLSAILFLVPGVIVAVMLSLALPVLLAEPVAIKQVFGRSRALTRGSRLALLGSFVILYVAASAPAIAIRVAMGGFPAYSVALGLLLGAVMGALLLVAPTVAYHDLRVAKEGGDTAQLARVFE